MDRQFWLLLAFALNFILGMWVAAKVQAFLFRKLKQSGGKATIEERENGMIAVVFEMPAEFRPLAEKIIEKTKR